MLLVRQLIYKEKTLDDFDIDGDESIFKLFFDLLLNMDGTRVVFGQLWNEKPETLRSYLNKALEQKKSLEFQERLKNILD